MDPIRMCGGAGGGGEQMLNMASWCHMGVFSLGFSWLSMTLPLMRAVSNPPPPPPSMAGSAPACHSDPKMDMIHMSRVTTVSLCVT